jgi:hypothetical protein
VFRRGGYGGGQGGLVRDGCFYTLAQLGLRAGDIGGSATATWPSEEQGGGGRRGRGGGGAAAAAATARCPWRDAQSQPVAAAPPTTLHMAAMLGDQSVSGRQRVELPCSPSLPIGSSGSPSRLRPPADASDVPARPCTMPEAGAAAAGASASHTARARRGRSVRCCSTHVAAAAAAAAECGRGRGRAGVAGRHCTTRAPRGMCRPWRCWSRCAAAAASHRIELSLRRRACNYLRTAPQPSARSASSVGRCRHGVAERPREVGVRLPSIS